MSTKKTALVTGTSKGGLGDFLAQELHRRGFRVFATARTPSKVQHLKDLGLEIILMDVTVPASVENAATDVSRLAGGKLDVLINNSGIGYMSSLLDADLSAAKMVFDVNIFGLLDVTQALSPLLIASKGTIVNNGSIVGRVPVPFLGIYNASKAALEALSKQMRVEFAPFDVKVVHVNTGGVKSDFFLHADKKGLSEGSLYYPGHHRLNPWASGETHGRFQRTNPEEYARNLINAILRQNPPSCLWTGGLARLTWFATTFLWRNATDWMMLGLGVPDLKKAIFGDS